MTGTMSREQIQTTIASLQRMLGEQPAQALTVGELWEKYRPVARATLRSWKDHESRARMVLPFFGERQVGALTVTDVDAYREWRRGQVTRRKRPPTPATRNREVALLKALISFGVKRHLVPQNPIAGADDEPENNIRHSRLSEEDVGHLLKHCGPVLRALVLVLFDTGMRRMEAIGLRRDEVDLETGWVILRRTKNGVARRVKLSSRALDAVCAMPPGKTFIFENPRTGKPFHALYLYRCFRRAVEAAGLKGVGGERIVLHTLRHSFAYVARRHRKLPEQAIMAMGGWRTRTAFDRYGITDEEEVAEGWERFDAGLGSRETDKATVPRKRTRQRSPRKPRTTSPRRSS